MLFYDSCRPLTTRGIWQQRGAGPRPDINYCVNSSSFGLKGRELEDPACLNSIFVHPGCLSTPHWHRAHRSRSSAAKAIILVTCCVLRRAGTTPFSTPPQSNRRLLSSAPTQPPPPEFASL